ncbi:MAG: hypothetical protein JRG96_14955 [Deltaproteobacteria bacterium]|nr:hypothetical protein [Deltaproteobacteria bacterium]
MKIGRWTIKWDGNCWVVGECLTRKRDGRTFEEIRKPKYYRTLSQALESLPQREAAELWNDCEDLAEFRERMGRAAKEMLGTVEKAVEERREAVESEDLGEGDAEHGVS